MDVHFNNVSIDYVIEYLEAATDYTFVYNDTDKEGVKVSVSLKDADIITILDAVFKDTPLAYQIKEERIVVLRRKNIPTKTEQEKQLVVKGRVISEKEKEPIIGATVVLEGTTLGVAHGYGRKLFVERSQRSENPGHQQYRLRKIPTDINPRGV